MGRDNWEVSNGESKMAKTVIIQMEEILINVLLCSLLMRNAVLQNIAITT